MPYLKIILLLLILSTGKSQVLSDFDLIQGPVEEEKRSAFEKTICSWNDYYIIVRRIKNKYSIEKLNEKLVSVKAIDATEFEDKDGKKRVYTNTVCINNKVYLITTKTIKKKSITVYFQEIELDNFELTGEVKIMNETDISDKKKKQTRFVFGGIGYSKLMAELGDYSAGSLILSPNEKKVLSYSKSLTDRDGPDIITVLVQDDQLTKEWENDSIALPYNTMLFDIEKVKLTNNGDILLSGQEYFEKRKSKKDNLPNYKYHLLYITNQGKKIQDYDIQLSGKFITDCQFLLHEDEKVTVTGFYSEKDASSIKGAFYIKIDLKTKEIITQKLKDFSFDFIVSGLSEKQKEKEEKKKEKGKEIELLDFYLDELILNDNGTISLIAEQFEITTYQTYSPGANGSPGTWTTHYRYYYNDIIVVNFSDQGEINWSTKINKYQSSTDDGGYYSSYALTAKNDNLYIVFNDHPDNFDKKEGAGLKTYIRGRETSQVVIKINADGNTAKEELFKSERGEVILRPKAGIRSENGNLMLYSNRRKEYQFSLLKMK
jgi:hypothetical protein